MRDSDLQTVAIHAVASELPGQSIPNQMLLDRCGSRMSSGLQQMLSGLGVEERYSVIANYPAVLAGLEKPDQQDSALSLGVVAARRTLDEVGAGRIGLVIGVTNTSPRIVPGFSSELMAMMPELPREAMNLNLHGQGCSPFLKAIDVARWYLASSPKKMVLIVCAENPTTMSYPLLGDHYLGFKEAQSPSDKQNTVDALHAFLFGDSAVAIVVGAEPGRAEFGPIVHLTNVESEDAELGSIDGVRADPLFHVVRPIYRLGPRIAERGGWYSDQVVRLLLRHEACTLKDIREVSEAFVHTGSARILSGVSEGLGLPRAAARRSDEILRKYGNLISASLPMMLADGLTTAGGKILMLGFGLGFSASASELVIQDLGSLSPLNVPGMAAG